MSNMQLASTPERNCARDLVVQLNSGALPVQLSVLQEQNVDATLGDDAAPPIRYSRARFGLLVVILFMVLYYRVPGATALMVLVVYAVVTLALFKLIPVTLTLAGIGAFVLSVGMAVDAHLAFERMNSRCDGSVLHAMALDAAFRRAWPSIRDSNVSTMITTFILFVLGGGVRIPGVGAFQAPLVQAFAITLALGVLASMFSRAFRHADVAVDRDRRRAPPRSGLGASPTRCRCRA